eukprot:1951539-Amphidinium_carterae.1
MAPQLTKRLFRTKLANMLRVVGNGTSTIVGNLQPRTLRLIKLTSTKGTVTASIGQYHIQAPHAPRAILALALVLLRSNLVLFKKRLAAVWLKSLKYAVTAQAG